LIFTHDTEVALQAMAALINTADGDTERLPDVASLAEFVRAWGWTGKLDEDEAELRAVRELRPRLRRLWQPDVDQVAGVVNELLREANAVPQLVKHDDWGYHVHATSPEAPLATRMSIEAAMALTDVIRVGELARMRGCDYPGCDNVVVDLSKNRSKRYCEQGCGNRAAVAAYRARKSEAATAAAPGRAGS
jgi:predicted RNA-binding Zn ribbon-like protein